MEEKKVYLLFPDNNDIFTHVKIVSTRSELNNVLLKEELIEEGHTWEECDWVVFEDGVMIRG